MITAAEFLLSESVAFIHPHLLHGLMISSPFVSAVARQMKQMEPSEKWYGCMG